MLLRELFSRCQSGIYARYPYRGEASYGVYGQVTQWVGLTLRVRQAIRGGATPPRYRRDRAQAVREAWRSEQLHLLPMPDLIHWLQARSGSWILGLAVQSKRSSGYEYITLFAGDPVVCTGLADRIAWVEADSALSNRLKLSDYTEGRTQPVDEMLVTLRKMSATGHPDHGFNLGLPILLEHALNHAAKEEA